MTQYILWADLETTGTDKTRDLILEIALEVTTKDLKKLGSYQSLIYHPTLNVRSRTLPGREIDEVVKEMHTKNGLWDDLEKVPYSGYSINEVDERCANFAKEFAQEEELILGGSSVHFDRGFIELYLPRLARMLHYRNFDVSTLKRAAKWWNFAQFPKDEPAHRAMADIQKTIGEARYIKDTILTALFLASTKGPCKYKEALIREIDGKLEVLVGDEIYVIEPEEEETLLDCYPRAYGIVDSLNSPERGDGIFSKQKFT